MNHTKKIITAIVLVLIVIVTMIFVFDWGRKEVVAPDITQTATSTLIIVSYPVDNQTVTSPIHITGTAKGNWFFEGSFPIQLIDSNGDVITTVVATAQSDWMTTNFVNFSAEISYPASTTGSALLVLNKDNPSGLPEFDAHIFVPVILK